MRLEIGDLVEAAGMQARVICLYKDRKTALLELEQPAQRGPRIMTRPIAMLTRIEPDERPRHKLAG